MIGTSAGAQAVDPKTVTQLQDEITRLRQELDAAKQREAQLRQQQQQAPQAAGPSAPAAAAAQQPTAPATSEASPVVPPGTATPAPDPNASQDLSAVVVTARNRRENLQDVPVPLSYENGRDLERDGAITFGSFAKRAANITVNEQNARQSSISIRGLGKQGATDAAEPSVGIIIDNVFMAYGAYSWTDFVDLDRVEVARGPQGTLLGKNTTLGVVNVQTRAPSFVPESYYELTAGSRNTEIAKGSKGGSLIDGLLAYRISFSADRSNGWIKNNFEDDATFKNTNRYGVRAQFLLTPADNLSARIIIDAGQSSQYDNGGSILRSDPSTFGNGASRTAGTGLTFTSRLARGWFNGYTADYGQANAVNINAQQPLKNSQQGISAEVNYTFGGYTLTSITAARSLKFIARNDNDNTPLDIAYNWNTDATNKQISQEFRLLSPKFDKFDYQVGLYALKADIYTNLKNQFGSDAGAFYATNAQYATLSATGTGQALLRQALDGVYTRNTQLPTSRSLAAYGQVNWHITDKLTTTLGLRETHETRDNSIDKVLVNGGTPIGVAGASVAELAAANAIRTAQVGTLYGWQQGSELNSNSTSWLITPSYKFSDNVLAYATASYGEKSGIALFNVSNGSVQNASPEHAHNFEVGLKGKFFGDRLILNPNLYQTRIRGYQQQLQLVDASQSTGFRTVTGNVDSVLLRGLELDSYFKATKALSFSAAAGWGTAIYEKFPNSGCPIESSNAKPVCDLTGQTLPGSSKVNVNLGARYAAPISNGLTAFSSVNYAFRTRTNYDLNLSDYGKQGAYGLVDFNVGVGRQDGAYDISLGVRNLFNKYYAINATPFTNQAPNTITTGEPRWLGVTFRSRI